MAIKLIQKHILRGTQEFELRDDAVDVYIKTPFKEKRLSVVLTILNPDPVINKPYLEFYSRVKCGPLISLYINKPNAEEFNAFVNAVRERAQQEYDSFLGKSARS